MSKLSLLLTLIEEKFVQQNNEFLYCNNLHKVIP